VRRELAIGDRNEEQLRLHQFQKKKEERGETLILMNL